MKWKTKPPWVIGGLVGLLIGVVHQFAYIFLWDMCFDKEYVIWIFDHLFPLIPVGIHDFVQFSLPGIFLSTVYGLVLGCLWGIKAPLNRTVKIVALTIISYHLIVYSGVVFREKNKFLFKDSGKKYCDDCADQGVKNSCFFSLAEHSRDASYCNYMGGGNYQLLCRAVVLKDVSLCYQADNSGREPYTTEDCIEAVNKGLSRTSANTP